MKIINLTFEIIFAIFLGLISFIITMYLINEFNPKKPRFCIGEPVKVHYGIYTGNEGYVVSAILEERIIFDKWSYIINFPGDTGIRGNFSIEERDLLKKNE